MEVEIIIRHSSLDAEKNPLGGRLRPRLRLRFRGIKSIFANLDLDLSLLLVPLRGRNRVPYDGVSGA
jgi:hypothetical protein